MSNTGYFDNMWAYVVLIVLNFVSMNMGYFFESMCAYALLIVTNFVSIEYGLH